MSVIEAQAISKSYSGVSVLEKVNFTLNAGALTGLVGENGAGKSTLIKILTGLTRPDSGRVILDGRPVSHWSHVEARRAGISLIPQELLLVPDLTVAQNIMLGQQMVRGGLASRAVGLRDDEGSERRAEELLYEIGVSNIDVREHVRGISTSKAQIVLIARALRQDARILILDEPTAALAAEEREKLFALLRRLLGHNTAILFVSHHLHEVEQLAENVTVLRNGRVVAELASNEITIPAMVQAMLDRSLDDQFPSVNHEPAVDTVLEARVANEPTLREVAFSVRRGEILGITGLLGAGKTELARALVGLDGSHGVVATDGHTYQPTGPRQGVRNGVLLVPEERNAQAIIPEMSVYRNGVISSISKGLRRMGLQAVFPHWRTMHMLFSKKVAAVGVRYATESQLAGRLSGGNQQKLVIARALACSPRVLVLDEPTRGVDVGSKRDIYRIIVEQAKAGLGVILISSDTREVWALSHRLLIFHHGVMAKELDHPRDKTHDDLLVMLSPAEFDDLVIDAEGIGEI